MSLFDDPQQLLNAQLGLIRELQADVDRWKSAYADERTDRIQAQQVLAAAEAHPEALVFGMSEDAKTINALKVQIDQLEAEKEFLCSWHYPFHVREAVRTRDREKMAKIAKDSDDLLKGMQDKIIELEGDRRLRYALAMAQAAVYLKQQAEESKPPQSAFADALEWASKKVQALASLPATHVAVPSEKWEQYKGTIEHEPDFDAPHGLEEIRRWWEAESKKIEAEGNLPDTDFRCVSDGGNIFYFDPDTLLTHVLISREDLITQLANLEKCNTGGYYWVEKGLGDATNFVKKALGIKSEPMTEFPGSRE